MYNINGDTASFQSIYLFDLVVLQVNLSLMFFLVLGFALLLLGGRQRSWFLECEFLELEILTTRFWIKVFARNFLIEFF
jgi:hypothetical protein